jgi:tRNA(fMet)-specific endonuclease VapC
MLTGMLDSNIYVIKTYPPALRERFNALAEQLCIRASRSARGVENLIAIEHFFARLEVLPFRRNGHGILRTAA